MTTTRRDVLRMAGVGAGAAMAPGLIDRALAIAPGGSTGSIRDVEHIVVFMQENRSFDHYFGMLNGVRGFGDPRPLRLPGGRTVWSQPSAEHPDGYVMPYHGDSKISRSFHVDGAGQSHQDNVGIFDRGRYDGWGLTGELHKRMLYHTAGDLPFYYALADAFTICDAYHCSTLTQTYPNRLHLFTGCNGGGTVGGDPMMQNYGEDETPSADMAEDHPLDPAAYRWTTYAERLEKAGVSWKVYQEYDNFGDNLLSVFPAFRPCAKDSSLYARGRAWVSETATGPDRTRSDGEQLVAAFRKDLAEKTLPQISWIVTAADLSEHPQAEPSKGEHVCAELIAALVDHPEMFSRTAFIINYDEAGGFYDHMPPPVPPVTDYPGHSTVPLDGESKDYAGYHGDDKVRYPGKHPIGLGIRTPTIIVSPWSRGGFVCSELFDHTSVIRFMEQRFGVQEPNISPWRRAVCGDLTSAFDFTANRGERTPPLPDTSDFQARVAQSLAGTENVIPAEQRPTVQMTGQRPHRPLGYALEVIGQVTPAGRLRIEMINRGRLGATFSVHDNKDKMAPWNYTIGAGDSFASEQWHDSGALHDVYDLSLRGPNGLYRRYAGSLASDPRLEAFLAPMADAGEVELALVNRSDRAAVFFIQSDERYPLVGPRARRVAVAAGATARERWSVQASANWYDLDIRVEGMQQFRRRFAGKVETGKPGHTDPGISSMQVEA